MVALAACSHTQAVPAAERLKLVIAREKQMPALLQQARANLKTPPKIFTEIAIEQVDGNQSFFAKDLPLAFAEVKDAALVAEFKKTNDAVIAALGGSAWRPGYDTLAVRLWVHTTDVGPDPRAAAVALLLLAVLGGAWAVALCLGRRGNLLA